MKILCIGDIVGRAGRNAIKELVPVLKKELALDFVIANGENAAGGSGVNPRTGAELFSGGCDVITTGDHIWDKEEVKQYLEQTPYVLRPANFPPETPGNGWCIAQTAAGKKVGVINLLGRVFIRYNTNCPFRELSNIVEIIKKETPVILVDIHAEATSEKVALGRFIDGEVSAVLGTHTHIPTADEQILPKGTAYITDLGMTGPHDSVIGQNAEAIIKRFLTGLPTKFEVATQDIRLNGVVVDIDDKTGKALNISRIQRRLA